MATKNAWKPRASAGTMIPNMEHKDPQVSALAVSIQEYIAQGADIADMKKAALEQGVSPQLWDDALAAVQANTKTPPVAPQPAQPLSSPKVNIGQDKTTEPTDHQEEGITTPIKPVPTDKPPVVPNTPDLPASGSEAEQAADDTPEIHEENIADMVAKAEQVHVSAKPSRVKRTFILFLALVLIIAGAYAVLVMDVLGMNADISEELTPEVTLTDDNPLAPLEPVQGFVPQPEDLELETSDDPTEGQDFGDEDDFVIPALPDDYVIDTPQTTPQPAPVTAQPQSTNTARQDFAAPSGSADTAGATAQSQSDTQPEPAETPRPRPRPRSAQ